MSRTAASEIGERDVEIDTLEDGEISERYDEPQGGPGHGGPWRALTPHALSPVPPRRNSQVIEIPGSVVQGPWAPSDFIGGPWQEGQVTI